MSLQTILDALLPYEDAEVDGLRAEATDVSSKEATVDWLISPAHELLGPVAGRIHFTYDPEKDVLRTDSFSVDTQRGKGVLTRFAAHAAPVVSEQVKRWDIATASDQIAKVLLKNGWTGTDGLYTLKGRK